MLFVDGGEEGAALGLQFLLLVFRSRFSAKSKSGF